MTQEISIAEGFKLKPITKRQYDVYHFIVTEVWDCGMQPTIRGICDHFGWSGTNAASTHLRALEVAGWVSRGRGCYGVFLDMDFVRLIAGWNWEIPDELKKGAW